MNRLKHIRRAIRRPIESFFFWLATFCVPLLPRRAVVSITGLIGRMTYIFDKRERMTGLANLDAVFGDTRTPAEKKTILKKSLSSFACTMTDVFWFSRQTKKRTRQYQTFIPEAGAYFKKQAHVIITAHTGNWELIGLDSGLRGLNVASVAAVTKNKSVDKQLNTLRQKSGQTIIPREGALRTLTNRFRHGDKSAFVLDQNTKEEHGGIWVEFLGIPTPVSSAPAYLAYRTGTEIIFAFSLPVGGGKYEAHTGNVIQPPPYDKTQDRDAIVKDLTQQIMNVISEQIRAHPESWLWSYKHWRRIAPGSNPKIYPVYN
jgi:KDO2-lipid IV(A) lauroyltransferase